MKNNKEVDGIGISNLPNLQHNDFIKRGCNFNMLVVGSHGLGKTTFLNKLLDQNLLVYQPFEEKNNNPFWHLEAKCNIQTSYVEINEHGFLSRINITEVDAIGDSVDNKECYKPVIELLENHFDDYHRKFKQQTRTNIDDKRIHVCFYFLEPLFSIKKPDIETMKKLSKYCTIIPIIAKADLLNESTILDVKKYIRYALKANEILFFEDVSSQAECPFLIYNEHRDFETRSNTNWTTSTFNTQINDFIIMKRVILEKNAIYLIRETDQFYDNYRITRLLQASSDKEIINAKERIEKKIADYQKKINEMQTNIVESHEEPCLLE